ncbi:interferon-induced helicase C domain-containing protein 1 isoform X2 [Erpetoichthys calabaricus]|uniref:interferon-induced helicase C domain-containing protein 1 isoform X2 n=1 Tax=Erpetoichthys calabaricus TaxID=27687 RepID=UPI0022345427|nr:interferon-induced helicase C domain-containing protein 1 isoform X2 [Erpetoichthys calabaricus]
MESEDERFLAFIQDCYRNRIKKLINPVAVLDHINFIGDEEKEEVKQLTVNKGRICGTERLLTIIEAMPTPRPLGWRQQFCTALKEAGNKQAAVYLDPSAELPSASMEAENDYRVKLIGILFSTLKDMEAKTVALSCYERKVITEEDKQNIEREINNKGNDSGARLLLERIVMNSTSWFSDFIVALRNTGQGHLIDDFIEKEEDKMEMSVPEHTSDSQASAVDQDDKADDKSIDSSDSLVDSGDVTADDSLNPECDLYLAKSQDGKCIAENGSLDVSSDDQSKSDTEEESETNSSNQTGEIILRDYQKEVADPALQGKNIIICLPTGSGKTRVAVFIAKDHLDKRKNTETPGKVIVLVNKVPLVEQHHKKEFGKFLKHYKVIKVSGDSQLKISFTDAVRESDVIICTAQILENSLSRAKEEGYNGVRLSDLSLIIIDECHHTNKDSVYNNIMTRYIKQKMKNNSLRKKGEKEVPLPQILGLTASPGVGGAKNQQKAEEHILKICANLDASRIMTVRVNVSELQCKVKEPYKKFAIAEERRSDPFGDVIKRIMQDIHKYCNMCPLSDPGTQNYEQWVVQIEKKAAKEENQKERVCAEYLRKYNETLQLNDTIRMSDALKHLKKFYEEEMIKKDNPESDETFEITETDKYLFKLFRENKNELESLAKNPENENGKLAKLRTTILQQYAKMSKTKGIIFTQTRVSAIALHQWIEDNKKFTELGVRSKYIIGAGHSNVVKPMTSAEQKSVIEKFRCGAVNLLVSTTVTEEGIDIEECNIVIRYGLVTNEVAMVQARGRARAEESSYALVAQEGSGVVERESVNVYREKMMISAIENVQKLSQAEYLKKIQVLQIQTIKEKTLRKKKKMTKVVRDNPSQVTFLCRNCSVFVCTGDSIQIIERMHHVNVREEFKKLFIVRENKSLQDRCLDYQVNGEIACKKCSQTWGHMMIHQVIECPSLAVKNFVLDYGKEKKTVNKWSEVGIRFQEFDIADHGLLMPDESDSD